jgi:hypothetical protein
MLGWNGCVRAVVAGDTNEIDARGEKTNQGLRRNQ